MAGRAQVIRRFMESEYAKTRWPDTGERRQHARAFADAEVDIDGDRSGFFVDLSSYTESFADKETGPTWIHAVTVGEYDHPYYDNVKFDDDRIKRFETNIHEKVTGIDPDIDYEHKHGSKGGAAAGWVVDAKSVLTDDDIATMSDLSGKQFSDPESAKGLWVLVDWTEPARSALANREYRYFSPELAEEWTHPKKKRKFKDVFMGGGITNRPFLKDLTPLNFDEALTAWENDRDKLNSPREGEGVKLEDILALLDMTREEACEKLSLSEDAKDKDIIEAAKSKMLATLDEQAEVEPPKPDLPANISKEFAEQFPAEAERIRKLEEENAANTAALIEAATEAVLLDLFEGRVKNEAGEVVKRALPPVVRDDVRELRLSLTGDLSEKFDSVLTRIVTAGTVSLESVPDPRLPEDGSDGADTRMVTLVKELQDKAKEEGKTLSFTDGVRQIAKDHPELAREWQASKRRQASGE